MRSGDGDNAPAQFNDCGFIFGVLSFLQLVSQLLKLRRFRGGESAGGQQSKNGDRERSQVGRDLGRRDAKVQAISGGFSALPSAQEDLPAGTELEHFAPAAVRLARIATAAPVPDQPVTPVCPMLTRHELHQIELNLSPDPFVSLGQGAAIAGSRVCRPRSLRLYERRCPGTTFAVLRPTPGKAHNSAIVSGTFPPCFSTISRIAPRMLFALLR